MLLYGVIPLVLVLAEPAKDLGTGPQPAANPIAWEFDLKFLDPQRIEVQLPGTSEPEVFWYLVYTATNPSQRTQHFFPIFQIVTEDLTVHDTDTAISPLVFDAIRERHKVTHKYLVSPTAAIGPLASGDDNARESVAIWRQIDLSHNNFVVYVAGLSGESRFISNPAARRGDAGKAADAENPTDGEKKAGDDQVAAPKGGSDKPTAQSAATTGAPAAPPGSFTLRKTLEIRYNMPGSPSAMPGTIPERGEIRWIMR